MVLLLGSECTCPVGALYLEFLVLMQDLCFAWPMVLIVLELT